MIRPVCVIVEEFLPIASKVKMLDSHFWEKKKFSLVVITPTRESEQAAKTTFSSLAWLALHKWTQTKSVHPICRCIALPRLLCPGCSACAAYVCVQRAWRVKKDGCGNPRWSHVVGNDHLCSGDVAAVSNVSVTHHKRETFIKHCSKTFVFHHNCHKW